MKFLPGTPVHLRDGSIKGLKGVITDIILGGKTEHTWAEIQMENGMRYGAYYWEFSRNRDGTEPYWSFLEEQG